MNISNIKGLYFLDYDSPYSGISIPEGDPAHIIEELGLGELVLGMAEDVIPNDEAEYSLHVLLEKETFGDNDVEIGIGIWARKDNSEVLDPKRFDHILRYECLEDYIEPDLYKILHPTNLCTDREQDILDYFDKQSK